MSLLAALASRVVTVRSDLPVVEIDVASSRLRSALSLLAATLAASSGPSPALLLASASSHLDAAAGALGRAGDELSRYLASVGVVSGVPVPSAVAVSGSCPWADRVDVLTAQVGVARPSVDDRLSVSAVLRSAVSAASRGDRVALRQSLVVAPDSVGWSLAAHAAGRLGSVAPGSLQRDSLALLPRLLPGLPASDGAALVAQALRLPGDPVSAHPADVAAVGVVLVSVVLSLTGASPEDL
ncbi:hypothetical protein SAMN05421812_103124 [Asanoa hainanensis]|uniref:Uncharacterized protein n=1 Tax=Asanoa hainanensis TaxID=560556 RepID=A0A239JTY6_9ACTN|nr:hypothetical protein [Asanoa hainanensis]SNT09280.1 hypothetical protein SAMN05421812_103124 [Asanoa hainanensis]